MEIALRNDIPTFSGGLGVLAGDTLKSFADLAAPVVAVTLIYNNGYFVQNISKDGVQEESLADWDPARTMKLLGPKVELCIENHSVWVRAWQYDQKGLTGHIVPVIFLDTNLVENYPEDRAITQQLYSGDNSMRIHQEVVLGIGGAKMLEALGYRDLKTYHMNEGHAAFLTFELLARLDWKDEAVRRRCVFTTHTPVPAGHDEFDYELVQRVLGVYTPWHVRDIAGRDRLNMTVLALNMSRYANGVAQKHGEVSRRMFPDFDIDAITNGVHSATWTAPAFQALYDKYIPGWRADPEKLAAADKIPDAEIVSAHNVEKAKLLAYIQEKTGEVFAPEILTVGFARRAATYKRGDLLFTDLERLVNICRGKAQFVFAGKAHPRDIPGKEVIRRIVNIAKKLRLENKLKVVFLENYDMALGALLTAGADAWLNNPVRPREASGTSGMKAAHNAVPNFSVLDGWWIEGCVEGVTGWSIGPPATENDLIENSNDADARDLYEKLEKALIPAYYNDRPRWAYIMKNAVAKNASVFNTHRMCKEYLRKSYTPKPVAVA
jgi:starch phosphorylase